MNTIELYQKLVEHLNESLLGLPKGPTLIQVLKVVFPPDEAEIALRLPMQNTKLSALIALYPETENLEEILNRMVEHGTVFCNQDSGQEKVYRLLSGLGGWLETPFWGGKDTPLAREMAPLFKKIRTQEFSDELSRGAPMVRVIPVSESLNNNSEVLPYDQLVPKIETASYRAVAFCPCRQASNLLSEGCDHTVENCLHFGAFARFMVDHDMAREITYDETLSILENARQEGLVHVANNMDDHIVSICSCCTCGGCFWLVTVKEMNRGVLLPSNYVAVVNEDQCTMCGTCEERCPMDAIVVGDGDCATVNADDCIGCGVCTPTCDDEAVKLALRETIKTPPNMAEWATLRLNSTE